MHRKPPPHQPSLVKPSREIVQVKPPLSHDACTHYATNVFHMKQALPSKGSIFLLEEEENAIEQFYISGRFLNALQQWQHPQKEALLQELIHAIHLIQLGLGSLRFWHSFNEKRSQGLAVMTSSEDINALIEWGEAFRVHTLHKPYPPFYRVAFDALMEGWDAAVSLTREFPNQHVYHDMQRGLLLCDQIFQQLYDAGFNLPDTVPPCD